MLLGAGRVDHIHLRELFVEGCVREHATAASLVVAEDSNGEAYGMLLVREAGRQTRRRARVAGTSSDRSKKIVERDRQSVID
jgi:hypothetical protein